jgi:hypothetical protein
MAARHGSVRNAATRKGLTVQRQPRNRIDVHSTPDLRGESTGNKKGQRVEPVDLFAIPGAPGRIRTSDPQVRSLVLYPAELRARCAEAELCRIEAAFVNRFARWNWRRLRDSNPRWSF